MGFADNLAALKGTRITLPPEAISGLTLNIVLDSSNQNHDDKYAALRSAVERVSTKVPNAFQGLANLDVYFGGEVKCEACWNPEGPGGSLSLFLGDRMMFGANPLLKGQNPVFGMGQKGARGVADQIYDSKSKSPLDPSRWLLAMRNSYQASRASAKATAVVVHELGHIIHERRSPESFWNNKKTSAGVVPADLAAAVSSYLVNNNYDEFVAEVFTGLVHGKRYPPNVMEAYQRQGGPDVR